MTEKCKISAAMVSGSEERSYVLKVDGYSRAKALLKNGECVISAPFSVGGRDWALEFYPNGYPKNCSDFISVYLFHDPADADVKAKYTFSVLDTNGEPVPSYSCTSGSESATFSSELFYYGSSDFIRKADLERSVHLRDDCLSIRCDVTVMKENHDEEEARVPPSDLHQHLGDLLKNKDAADLAFQVGGEIFSAHRCVLAARSSVFRVELLGSMQESSAACPIEMRFLTWNLMYSIPCSTSYTLTQSLWCLMW